MKKVTFYKLCHNKNKGIIRLQASGYLDEINNVVYDKDEYGKWYITDYHTGCKFDGGYLTRKEAVKAFETILKERVASIRSNNELYQKALDKYNNAPIEVVQ